MTPASQVLHDGKVERNPGRRNISACSVLRYGGEARRLPPPLFVALHKPCGYSTTMDGASRRPRPMAAAFF